MSHTVTPSLLTLWRLVKFLGENKHNVTFFKACRISSRIWSSMVLVYLPRTYPSGTCFQNAMRSTLLNLPIIRSVLTSLPVLQGCFLLSRSPFAPAITCLGWINPCLMHIILTQWASLHSSGIPGLPKLIVDKYCLSHWEHGAQWKFSWVTVRSNVTDWTQLRSPRCQGWGTYPVSEMRKK